MGLAAGALAAIGAGAAHGATPRWHPPVAISPQGSNPARPAVALASRGEAIAAWRASSRGRVRVEVRVRRGLRAPWSAAHVLATRSVSTSQPLSNPAVAMNARGDAVVLWQVAQGPLRSAVRRGWTGSWRTATVPAPPAGADPDAAFATPRLAIAPDGAAVALWTAQETGAWAARGALLAAGARTWQETPAPPLDPALPAPPRYGPPRIAVGPAGDAVVVWTAPSSVPGPGGSALRVVRRIGTGPWGAPVTPADPVGRAGEPAVSANGRVAVVWTGAEATPPSPVQVAVGEPGAAGLGAPDAIPAAAWETASAVNSRGDVLVAWSGLNEGAAHAAVRPAGGAWGATMTAEGGIAPTIGYEGAPVALDEAGTAHVGTFFADPDAQAHEWPFSVVTGTARGWAAPRRVSYGGGDGAIATAPGGTAIVLARGEPGTIWAASYDALPDVRVTARLHGRRSAGRRVVCWTVRVRNAGRIAAQGVRLRLRPRPGRPALRRLGRLAPGATRTIVIVVRLPRGPGAVSLQATVSAGGMPPVWVRRALP